MFTFPCNEGRPEKNPVYGFCAFPSELSCIWKLNSNITADCKFFLDDRILN